jgi:cysteine-rich repeat protein
MFLALAACASNVGDDGLAGTTMSGEGATSGGSMASTTTAAPESGSTTSTDGSGDDSTGAVSSTGSSSGDTTGGDAGTETGDLPTSSSSSGTGESVCGDGVLAEDELCDDGNLEAEDACSTDCEPQFYTGTGAVCNDTQALPCVAVGGECRRLIGDGGGGAVCYWPDYSENEMQCNSTAGVWTPYDSPFVENNELSVPEPGVCVTQSTNLRCTAPDQAVCSAAGADACFQYKLMSGGDSTSPSICWWDASEAACGATSGLWTATDTMFGMNNPNSIPPGADGSCISQVTNLD